MNFKNKKSLFGLFVILIMILSVSFGLTNKKQTEQTANAAIEYEYSVFYLDDGLWHQFFKCCECGHEYYRTSDDPDDYNDYWSMMEDWEILSDYCRHCFHGHLCEECHEELSDVLSCDVCNLCLHCWDDSTHCHHCGSCAEDLCQECLEQEGIHICLGCHTEQSHCPGCGICMYSLYGYGAVCQDYGEAHCIYCDEEWICNECGECFFI